MMRNFMSAAFFTVANGHFNLGKLDRAMSVKGTYFDGTFLGNAKEKELAYLKRIKQLGVVYDTPYAGEMMDLLKDTEFGNDLEMKGGKLGMLGKGFNVATRAYQLVMTLKIASRMKQTSS